MSFSKFRLYRYIFENNFELLPLINDNEDTLSTPHITLRYSTFINQARRCAALRSHLPPKIPASFLSSFAPRPPRCNWLSEGRPCRKGGAEGSGQVASKQITRGWFCPLQFASNILSYPRGLPAGLSTFLKLLLSALCFTNYRSFHLFRNRLCAYCLSHEENERSTDSTRIALRIARLKP